MDTLIISAFPGTGKTYFYNNSNKRVLDSDSSNFSWIDGGGIGPSVRNPEFPQNYIDHIKENIGKYDIILVSSHKEVRESLVKNGIKFTLIYPERNLKDEYLQRYINRGSDDKFIGIMYRNWDLFIDDMDNQEKCEKVVFLENTHLSSWIKCYEAMNQKHFEERYIQ
jgi:hypothetical protein